MEHHGGMEGHGSGRVMVTGGEQRTWSAMG